MYKYILYFVTGIMIISMSYVRCSVKSNASDYAEEWLRKKQEQQNEYMESLKKDGNLTDEVVKSITKGKGTSIKTNKKKKEDINKNNNSSKTTLVYGVDELHVIGLPTDERGYTQAGKYER